MSVMLSQKHLKDDHNMIICNAYKETRAVL